MSGSEVVIVLIVAVAIFVVATAMRRRKSPGGAEGEASMLRFAVDSMSAVEGSSSMGAPSGFALFVFRNGSWNLQEDFSKPGFVATPPAMQGSFEGQVLRRESGIPAK